MGKSLKDVINEFNDVFSKQDLDGVMNYFADNAEYRELNGNVALGKAKIRKAFQRAFDGAYGEMVFEPKNLIVDEEKLEACFVWDCQHSLNEKKWEGVVNGIVFNSMRLLLGKDCYWEGIDYFVFDDDLKILSKQSYGKANVPKFKRGIAKSRAVMASC